MLVIHVFVGTTVLFYQFFHFYGKILRSPPFLDAEFNGDVHFSCFGLEMPFLGKFVPKYQWKYQNCVFKTQFNTCSNLSKLNSMVMFIFSILDWKYPFWVNLAQKLKIVCLQWNSNPRLIRICWVRWWRSLFLFWTTNTLFAQIWGRKYQNFLFKMKFGNIE